MFKHNILLLLLIMLMFLGSCKPKTFISNKVIAHRGAWKMSDLPQNSIASLEKAIALGCEGSEFDVWMTKDSVLVVNHDADFEGMEIEQYNYSELLDGRHSNGEKLPTVEEYLLAGMKQTGTKLIFEIKPSKLGVERSEFLAEKSLNTVKALNAEEWVDYITFSYEAGLKIIELDSKARVAYLKGDKSPAVLSDAGFFGFDYNIKVLKNNPEWIKEAHDLGLTVNAWTVNKEEDMHWLLEKKVDFITTDEPEKLMELIKE